MDLLGLILSPYSRNSIQTDEPEKEHDKNDYELEGYKHCKYNVFKFRLLKVVTIAELEQKQKSV